MFLCWWSGFRSWVCMILCPGKEVLSMAGLKRLAVAVAPRLGFLDLDGWKVKSDELLVEHVINSKGSGQ